ncbi:MAG: GNAT family N-acetyltransferase [Candidatus Nitrosocosmicus sp.]|nr:GNAT family N-acetyltransferase [Candidatus Nitrosocosmicus sp.]MDN5865832.1 GNAT family N-acetyltransferase [Candidatus Nitrosocosmicus sp.]
MDYYIIEKLKSNEVEFCNRWSTQTIDFNDTFRILANQSLEGDYFLNRVILTDGIEEFEKEEKDISSIVAQIKKFSKLQAIDVYVHLNDNFSFLKTVLEKNGLKEIDKLAGLVNVVEDQKCLSLNEFELKKPLSDRKTCKIARSADELNDWLNVYSQSFGIDMEKRAAIRTIIQKESFRESKFIICEQKLNDKTNRHNLRPIGCCILFPTNDVLGLYCLGTDQRFRNRGIASTIIDFIITYAKINGFNFIGLQALDSDHTTGFYQRRHFATVYTNAIFSIPIS